MFPVVYVWNVLYDKKFFNKTILKSFTGIYRTGFEYIIFILSRVIRDTEIRRAHQNNNKLLENQKNIK